MQLHTYIDMVSNDFQVTLSVDTMSSRELENLSRRGNFVVDCGGVFLPPEGGAGFTLPTAETKVPDEFPVRRVFSVVELGHEAAAAQASLYADTMRERIHTALSDWLLPDPAADLSSSVTTLIGSQPTNEQAALNADLANYLNL